MKQKRAIHPIVSVPFERQLPNLIPHFSIKYINQPFMAHIQVVFFNLVKDSAHIPFLTVSSRPLLPPGLKKNPHLLSNP